MQQQWMGWQEKGQCEKLFFKDSRYWCQEIIGNPTFAEHMAVGIGCPEKRIQKEEIDL